MSTATYLPADVLTSCPSWCDHCGVGHAPDLDGDEPVTAHEGRVCSAEDFGQITVEQRATGPDADQAPTLTIDLQVVDVDVEDGEHLVAALTAAVEQLRQARVAR